MKNIVLQKADMESVGDAMLLIEDARAFLRSQGIDQWQDGYPTASDIEGDVERDRGYFLMADGVRVGYLCIDFGGEPTYEVIDGAWLSRLPYVVVHRMAIAAQHRGRGIASRAFDLSMELAFSRGVHSMRVDTQADNRIMQHIIATKGFTYCGIILTRNSERLAFERLL